MKNILKYAFIASLLMLSYTSMSQNHALYLDGDNNRIGVADAPELNPTGPFTLEIWIKAESWESSIWQGVIIGKQATSPNRGYNLTVGESGKAEFTVCVAGEWKTTTTEAIMGLDTWYHLACVYDGSSISLFINGILQSSNAVIGNLDPGTGTTLFFGDNPTWSGRFFHGSVDDVRIWNIAKTQQQIIESFTTELIGDETDLLAYWSMNEGTGLTTADLTSGANNGTLLNMEEADWVSGFEAPGADAGVIGIVSPALIGPDFTDEEAITIEIKNFTTETISNFDVSYQINGGAVVTETYTGTLDAFASGIYTFNGTVALSGSSSIEMTTYTSLEDDSNPENDSFTNTIDPSEHFVLFDAVQHNFGSAGQTKTRTAYITEHLELYSQILLHVDLTCPEGGCDPWDQIAQIWLKKNLKRYELARYITPYGVACGNWTYDITDFKSLLAGKADIESFIQVWGTSGWNVNLEIELVPGTPDYLYSKVDILWDENGLVYGDPNISYDLPVKNVQIANEAQSVKLRMTNTGHGQGNTDNAAEFKECTHQVIVNGNQNFDHHLWKDDCESNSCSSQGGTWTYSRAGWCPGQDVQAKHFDFASVFNAGQNLSVDYELEAYTNLLNTGYNSSGHTEPFYRIMGYLVTYGNQPLTTSDDEITLSEDQIKIYPNPAKDRITIEGSKDCKLSIYSVSGTLLKESIITSDSEQLNVEALNQGLYIIQLRGEKISKNIKITIY